jgi:hypothetical protein
MINLMFLEEPIRTHQRVEEEDGLNAAAAVRA